MTAGQRVKDDLTSMAIQDGFSIPVDSLRAGQRRARGEGEVRRRAQHVRLAESQLQAAGGF
jgi:hypothetical protein